MVLLVTCIVAPGLAQAQEELPVGTVPPDLYPTNIAASGSDERQPTSVCVTIMDIAQPNLTYPEFPSTLPAFNVRLDLYQKNIEGNHTVFSSLISRQPAGMSARANQQTSLCWTVEMLAGEYAANVLVDSDDEVNESSEDNNARPRLVRFIVNGAPRPDLAATLKVRPVNADGKTPQAFYINVLNQGGASSVPSTVEVRDETGLLGQVQVPALQPRQSKELFVVTNPANRPAGKYTARAVVDSLQQIVEMNEANNHATFNYTILPHPAPDLTFQNVMLNGTLLARRGLRIDAEIHNIGNVTSKATAVRLFIDGTPISNTSVPILAPGGVARVQHFLVLSAGNHTLRLSADPEGLVNELNELDNEHFLDVTITEPPPEEDRPNLVVVRFDASPDDPGPGEVVNLTTIVHNIGTRASNATTLRFIMDGEPIATIAVPRIAPDRFQSLKYPMAALPEGPYTLRAFVDPDAGEPETDESDNNHTLYFTVFTPPPPLVDAPNGTLPDETNTTPPAPVDVVPPANQTGASTVEITEMSIGTRSVPGGVKGTLAISLRNPTLQPLGRLLVTFRVDGLVVKETLVQSLASAGTSATSTGEIDLPGGTHTVTAEVAIAGSNAPPITDTRDYTAVAGEKPVPAPGAALALAVVAVAAWAARRRSRD